MRKKCEPMHFSLEKFVLAIVRKESKIRENGRAGEGGCRIDAVDRRWYASEARENVFAAGRARIRRNAVDPNESMVRYVLTKRKEERDATVVRAGHFREYQDPSDDHERFGHISKVTCVTLRARARASDDSPKRTLLQMSYLAVARCNLVSTNVLT